MKLIVCSDTHGDNDILFELQALYPEASFYVHCGDLEDNPDDYPGWVIVKGNNDYWYNFKEDVILQADGHRIYVCHSDQLPYFYRMEGLAKIACDHHCDIVLYGHTHVGRIDQVSNITLINPGSVRYPRSGQTPRYAIVNIENHKIDVDFIEL